MDESAAGDRTVALPKELILDGGFRRTKHPAAPPLMAVLDLDQGRMPQEMDYQRHGET